MQTNDEAAAPMERVYSSGDRSRAQAQIEAARGSPMDDEFPKLSAEDKAKLALLDEEWVPDGAAALSRDIADLNARQTEFVKQIWLTLMPPRLRSGLDIVRILQGDRPLLDPSRTGF
jgi:hypothetical protein